MKSDEMKTKTDGAAPGKRTAGRLTSVRAFLLCLSLLYFSKAFAGSYMKSSITSIERRFELPSSVTGMIDGGFEFGNLLVMAFVSFFGAHFHRPRIIAAGATLMGFSTLLTAMPHFLMGRYSYQSIASGSGNSSQSRAVCAQVDGLGGDGADSELLSVTLSGEQTTQPSAECEHESGSYLWVMVLIGNALRGIGEAPIGPLGISFFDDHVREENSAFYLGCVHTVGLLGPAFGFMLGAFCARIFVDIGFVSMAEVSISPHDARWVGAWWLGFLISGIVVLATATPLWFFPRSLPREGDQAATAATAATAAGEGGNSKEAGVAEPLRGGSPGGDAARTHDPVDVKEMAKELVPAVRALLGNRVYMLMLATAVMNVNALVGFYTFKAKYIEQQFGETASKANFMIGAVTIPVVAMGIFVGGIVSRKLKLSLFGFAIMSLLTDVPAYLLSFAYYLLGCSEARIVGLTVHNSGAPMETRSLLLDALPGLCNAACPCPPGEWDPVCGSNNLTYVSPCLAGCSTMSGSGKSLVFEQCACVGDAWMNGTAALGQCPRGPECATAFLHFMVVAVLSSFVGSVGFTASQLIFLRCIPKQLKSFAIGIQMLVVRTLAGITAPIFFGAAIDSTCLQWTNSGCASGRGSCRLYDIFSFRYTVISVMMGFRTVGFIFGVLVVVNVRRKCREEAAAAARGPSGEKGPREEPPTVSAGTPGHGDPDTGGGGGHDSGQPYKLLPAVDLSRETVV